jgi:hypothetical protein
MTALSGALKHSSLVCRKHEKIVKVTVSQNDGFVGGLETQLVGMREHEKIEKVTASPRDAKGESGVLV